MGTGTETHDMIDILVHDHREAEELFREIENSGTEPDRRGQLTTAVIAELVRHSIAEEQYLYPVTRQVLDDGDQIADKEIDDHSEAEQLMKRLERMQATDADFNATVRGLISEVREHITEEERDLFPRLRERCAQDQLADLGAKIDRAKRIAPTRPHPSAPNTPPANKLLAPGAGLVDRVRDALTNRPTSPEDVQ